MAQLQLLGWSAKRRVVIVRQRIRGASRAKRRIDGKQLRLDLAGPSVHEGDRLWEYAVLVTDVAYPLEAIGQLYRDRADAENAFDELKNQWRYGGFTTQDINRSRPWPGPVRWSTTGGVGTAERRTPRVDSRPLRAARRRLPRWARRPATPTRRRLYLTPLHGRADLLRKLIANIGAALLHVKAAAEQFKNLDRWGCLLRYISDRIAPVYTAAEADCGAAGDGVTAGFRISLFLTLIFNQARQFAA